MQLGLKNKRLLLLCLASFQLCCSFKKNDAQQVLIKPAALRQDIDILQTTLKEAHPGLYWYTDSLSMNKFFDSTKALLDHDMAPVDFFKTLLPVIANIRCVHSNLRLPQNVVADQFTRVLPFDFFIRDEKLFILRAFGKKGQEGAEILSINNTDAKKIIETLLSYMPADGYNQTFKYHLLNNGAFREGYALLFGQPESFSIRCINSQGRSYSFTVPAISPRQAFSPASSGSDIPFSLTFHQNVAILSVNTFEMNTGRFKDSIISYFQAIKQSGATHLIIDLRRNGGGTNGNVSTLYSFIATAPFLHLKRAEMNAAVLTYPQYIINPQSIPKFETGTNGKYLVNDRYAGTFIKNPADKNLFQGKVILLTSGKTTSAASEFVAIAHYLKRATIVGEETGGCYYGATGGNYLQLKLPNSGFEVRIPTIRIFTAVDQDYNFQPKGRGTLPDYEILPTVDDVLRKTDVQLAKALELSKK